MEKERQKKRKVKTDIIDAPSQRAEDTCNNLEPLKKKLNTIKLLPKEKCSTQCESVSEEFAKPLLYRENDTDLLKKFLLEHLATGDPGLVYISGPPGTGKTATVEYVLHLQEISDSYNIVRLNCVELESPASIFKNICNKLNIKTSNNTQTICCKAIEQHLSKKPKAIVLVLDEIDALKNKGKNLLLALFTLVSTTGLFVVSMSNSPALMIELKPHLRQRTKMKIHELQFAPYDKDQIMNVITKELANNENIVWEPFAIKMLAAKASLKSGDMRRALHMVRHLSRLARQPNGSGTVRITDVTSAYDNLSSSSISRMVPGDDLPLHQKLLLCTYLVILNHNKKKDVTFGVLHNVYTKVAKSRGVNPLGCEEAWNMCELLDCRGAVSAVKKKNSPLPRWLVHLRWDQEDLEAVIKDKALLGSILIEGRSFL